MENNQWRNVMLTAFAPIIWGTTYIATTELLPPGRPLFGAAMRALPVGLLILLFVRRLPEGKWWWRVFVLGALNIGLFFALLFTAAYRLPGGIASTVGAAQPFIVAILAHAFISEKLTVRKSLAALAGAVGVAMIVISPSAIFDSVGLAAAFAGTIAMGAGTILTKRWGQPAPILVFTSWQLVAGGLILAPLALLVEGMPPALSLKNASGFLYLGLIGTGTAYAVWVRGVKRLKASTVTFLTLLSPISAMTIDLVILGRSLTAVQLAGAVVVIAAVITSQAAGKSVKGETQQKIEGGGEGKQLQAADAVSQLVIPREKLSGV